MGEYLIYFRKKRFKVDFDQFIINIYSVVLPQNLLVLIKFTLTSYRYAFKYFFYTVFVLMLPNKLFISIFCDYFSL